MEGTDRGFDRQADRLPPSTPPSSASRYSDAYHRTTLRSVAVWCIDHRLDALGRGPALRGSRSSRSLRGYELASTWITLALVNQNLCRHPMPRPKFGRSLPTTPAAAPATFCLVHLQVVGREQMAIAADIGYGHGLGDTFEGKAHHISFGCFKSRPRYHF